MTDCSDHHEKILDGLEELDKKIEYHLGTTHQHLVDARTVKEWDSQILEAVQKLGVSHKRLADAVMGQQREDVDGFLFREPRDSISGQVEKNIDLLRKQGNMLKEQGEVVDRIEHQLGNGIKFRLGFSDQVKVAIIAAIATIAGAYFG